MAPKGIIGAAPGLRSAHGNGADAIVRSEVVPPDEQVRIAVHAHVHAEAGTERRANGTWTRGSRTAQAAGGRAKKGAVKMASSLGLEAMATDPAFAPFIADAKPWIREQRKALATTYGGGVCGVAPSTLVVAAGWLQAAARFLMSTAEGDPKRMLAAANLQDKARTSILTASQICAAEAQARPKTKSRLPWETA